MSQTISDPTAAEKSWIEGQIRSAIQFITDFSPSDSDNPLTLTALDSAFKAWLASDPAPATINDVVNAVGTAFGELLVKGGEFRWVIVSDEHGADLAILALPGQGDVLVFPGNFVAKRWERRETDFLERSFANITASVQAIRDEWKAGHN